MSVSATNKNKIKTWLGLKDSFCQMFSIYRKKLQEMDLRKPVCCVWDLMSSPKCLKPGKDSQLIIWNTAEIAK